MISFLIRLAVNAIALLIIARLSGGAIAFSGFGNAVLAALVLGIANAVVKPALQMIAEGMTCVLSCLTLGLSSLLISWLINGLLFYLVGNTLGLFEVKTFWAAMLGALALSVVNALIGAFSAKDDKKR
jgi:putative membrane protein